MVNGLFLTIMMQRIRSKHCLNKVDPEKDLWDNLIILLPAKPIV